MCTSLPCRAIQSSHEVNQEAEERRGEADRKAWALRPRHAWYLLVSGRLGERQPQVSESRKGKGRCEGHSPKGVLYYLMAAGQHTEGMKDPSKLSKHARPSITAGKLPISRAPPGETGEPPDSSST